jgi:RNA 2',3'-cyclic 3'-phosphodiesterase
MRLFVGVWPPEKVRERLAETVDGFRTSHEGIRWEPPERWHVTLRFLGKVSDADAVVEALEQAPLTATDVELGPTVGLLGRQVLYVPVAGMDDLAGAVRQATAELGEPPDARGFRGHLTLARLGGRQRQRRRRSGVGFTREWLGTPVEGRWRVDAVHLVRSQPGPNGSTYDDLHVRHLDA